LPELARDAAQVRAGLPGAVGLLHDPAGECEMTGEEPRAATAQAEQHTPRPLRPGHEQDARSAVARNGNGSGRNPFGQLAHAIIRSTSSISAGMAWLSTRGPRDVTSTSSSRRTPIDSSGR